MNPLFGTMLAQMGYDAIKELLSCVLATLDHDTDDEFDQDEDLSEHELLESINRRLGVIEAYCYRK